MTLEGYANIEECSVADKIRMAVKLALEVAEDMEQSVRDARAPAEVRERVVEEVTMLEELVDGLDDYVLVHKSHIDVSQAYDMRQGATLRQVCLLWSRKIHQNEVAFFRGGSVEALQNEIDEVTRQLIKYLEAPKPEQTPPAQT